MTERYRLTHVARAGLIWSEVRRTPITWHEVMPDHVIIRRLEGASDAPLDKLGEVRRSSLPTEVTKWAKIAFARLLRELPDEGDQGQPSEKETAAWRVMVLTLLHTMTSVDSFARTIGASALDQALDGEAEVWRRVPKHSAWGYRGKNGEILIAIRPELAAELGKHKNPEVIKLTPTEFTNGCKRHGIAADLKFRPYTETGQVSGATVLTSEFVQSLDLVEPPAEDGRYPAEKARQRWGIGGGGKGK